ncbi:MAG: 50S ribosome-binding GTPase [Planctomycetia bacterium]|nr:50S ribosome-binding GTPase [Planctomycetia bacterium]
MSEHENGNQIGNNFLQQYNEVKQKFVQKRPNILVCGYTGSGKSSLLQAILGDEIVPDDKIGSGSPRTPGFDKYENNKICIWDSKGLNPGETEEEFTATTREFIRRQQSNTEDLDNHIHLVWYTIQGSGGRVTDCDTNLIKNVFSPDNVIVVITKRDLMRPRQLDDLLDVLKQAGIPESRIIATCDKEGGSIGCRELVDLTHQMLPEAYKAAWISAQQVNLEMQLQAVRDKRSLAKKIITTATATASGIGLIPIPLSDATLLLPTQMGMIAGLAALYEMDRAVLGNIVLPFVTQCAGIVTATSLTKLIPGLGSLINAGVAGTLTGAMGFFVMTNFEDIAMKRIKHEPVPEFGLDFDTFRRFYQDYIKGNFNGN